MKLWEKKVAICRACLKPCMAQLVPSYYADLDPDWLSDCCRDLVSEADVYARVEIEGWQEEGVPR